MLGILVGSQQTHIDNAKITENDVFVLRRVREKPMSLQVNFSQKKCQGLFGKSSINFEQAFFCLRFGADTEITNILLLPFLFTQMTEFCAFIELLLFFSPVLFEVY